MYIPELLITWFELSVVNFLHYFTLYVILVLSQVN